jgi:acyl-coenzyme A thioesterase PaaI-like protein
MTATIILDSPAAAPQPTVLRQWAGISRLPFGRRLFSWLVGFTVPYAGSINAQVLQLAPGFAEARMADRRKLRNHLRSLHAVALTNLAELTGNLALMSRQPPKGTRWIVSGFDSDYLKKARGPITAQCTLAPLDWSNAQAVSGLVELRDSGGDLVMVARPRWRIGPA